MERQKHSFNLGIYHLQVGNFSQLVKNYCVAFDFRYFQVHFIGIYDSLQQLFYNMTAMIKFSVIHKMRETAYVRNEYESFCCITYYWL